MHNIVRISIHFYNTLHNLTIINKTPRISVFKQTFCYTKHKHLRKFTKRYTNSKLQHVIRLCKITQHFTTLYNTLQHSTTFSQNSTTLYTTRQLVHNSYKTLQHYPKLYKPIQNFIKLYKKTFTHMQKLHKLYTNKQNFFTKVYNMLQTLQNL